jgi:hypothetical protein
MLQEAAASDPGEGGLAQGPESDPEPPGWAATTGRAPRLPYSPGPPFLPFYSPGGHPVTFFVMFLTLLYNGQGGALVTVIVYRPENDPEHGPSRRGVDDRVEWVSDRAGTTRRGNHGSHSPAVPESGNHGAWE